MWKNKKSKIGLVLIVTILMLLSISTSSMLAVKLPEQIVRLNEGKEQLKAVENKKVELEKMISESQKSIEALEGELNDSKASLQVARDKNPDLAKQLENVPNKYAYLTFDDGPSKNTIQILDFLKANNIKATFFVLGTQSDDEIYNRIVDEGHTLALHTNTHKYDEIYISVETFMDDINTLSKTIEDATGVVSKVLRFPGGSNNTISYRYGGDAIMDDIIQRVNEEGYVYFDWNVDSMDASAKVQSKDVIVNSVLDGARNKQSAIILMHDAALKTTTVEALPEIIEGLRAQGFSFDKITVDTPPIQAKK